MTVRCSSNVWAVILAANDARNSDNARANLHGSSVPSQYCTFGGRLSLIQRALRRALRFVPPSRIMVVVNADDRCWWEPALWLLPRWNIIVEPGNASSPFAELLSLLLIGKTHPSTCVMCLPAKHDVGNEDILEKSLRQALANAALVDRVQLVDACPDNAGARTRTQHDWSSGIVVGQMQLILDQCARQVPDLMQYLRSAVRHWPDPQVPPAALTEQKMPQCTTATMRHILLSEPQHLQLVPVAACGWRDVSAPGGWVNALGARRIESARNSDRAERRVVNFGSAAAKLPAPVQRPPGIAN